MGDLEFDVDDPGIGEWKPSPTNESLDASALLNIARLHAEKAYRAVSNPEDPLLELCKRQVQAAIRSLENASASFWKIQANKTSSNVQDQDKESSGDLMDGTLGSQGLVKKSEFIRLIIEALFSLGYDGIAADLEKDSGVDLHNPTTKQFLELIKKGEWDKSIDALKSFELRDEKPVRFLLLEQKVFDIWNNVSYDAALTTVKEEIAPLGIWPDRVRQLTYELTTLVSEYTKFPKQRSKEAVNKLQRLFPPGVIIPERRLEYLLEQTLDRQRSNWELQNGPASDFNMSLCSDRYDPKTPTETVQVLREHTHEVCDMRPIKVYQRKRKKLIQGETSKGSDDVA